jgi:MFS family permease
MNIAGPFFNVYMVDSLKMTAAAIGLTTVVNTVATMLIQRRVGALSDRWGNRNLALISLFLIPFIPLIWGLWIQSTWQVLLTETFSGMFWGAYNLVSFNILLAQTPPDRRARFSALYQIVVTLSLAGGAALGSFLIPMLAFKGVAVISAIGRWLAGLVFIFLVRDTPSPTDDTALEAPEGQLDDPAAEDSIKE